MPRAARMRPAELAVRGSIDASARAAPAIRARAVVLTELFPPAIGGSGELLANVYSRFGDIPVTVLTGGAADAASASGLSIIRDVRWGPHWGLLHPAGCWTHLVRTRRLLRIARRAPAVVHCGRVIPEGLDGYLAMRFGGSAYLCWAHGEELMYARHSREIDRLMRLVFRHAAAIIANSQSTASRLVDFGVPAARVSVARPGVDAMRFAPAVPGAATLQARLASRHELVLLTVGRLQRRKGHDLVLQTLAQLGPESPPVRYVIVGGGPEEARLRQLSSELGVGDRVVFVGEVAAVELPRYYAAADLFVHPNRIEQGDFEGFGLVLLEAAAAGLPVIAGATGGTPEAVKNGTTGVLVSGVSIEELRSAVLELAGSPVRRRAMGEAGRAMVLNEFTWEHAAAAAAATHVRVASS